MHFDFLLYLCTIVGNSRYNYDSETLHAHTSMYIRTRTHTVEYMHHVCIIVYEQMVICRQFFSHLRFPRALPGRMKIVTNENYS